MRLKISILCLQVSAIAVPNEMERDSVLRPNMFKVVEPTKEGRFVNSLKAFLFLDNCCPHSYEHVMCVTGTHCLPISK